MRITSPQRKALSASRSGARVRMLPQSRSTLFSHTRAHNTHGRGEAAPSAIAPAARLPQKQQQKESECHDMAVHAHGGHYLQFSADKQSEYRSDERHQDRMARSVREAMRPQAAAQKHRTKRAVHATRAKRRIKRIKYDAKFA